MDIRKMAGHTTPNMHQILGICTIFINLITIVHCYTSGFYYDNGVQQSMRIDVPLREKKHLKQEILTLLGLHHRPKPKAPGRHHSAPQYMIDLYNTIKDDVEDERESAANHKLLHLNLTMPGMEHEIGMADMIMSFINHPNHMKIRHEKNRRFYFDFSGVPAVERVTGAEMRLYKGFPPWSNSVHSATFTIHMYRVTDGNGYGSAGHGLDLLTKVTVSNGFEGWVDFDVTKAAAHWMNNPMENYGLYMTVFDSQGNEVTPQNVGLVDARGPENRQPFMVSFFKAQDKSQVHIRKRRSADRKSYSSRSAGGGGYSAAATGWTRTKIEACKLRTLYVKFSDLGWREWVIAPEAYSAYYCHGECSFPLNANMNATNHAIVQNLVFLMNLGKAKVPKPCCAPTKLDAQSVLYFDDNSNVIIKKYKNMVVTACGCQ